VTRLEVPGHAHIATSIVVCRGRLYTDEAVCGEVVLKLR